MNERGQRDEDTLRSSLLRNYRHGQAAISSSALYLDPEATLPYYDTNYARHLGGLTSTSAVLEVGCGQGSLLRWLLGRGFTDVHGVDASPGDVEFANEHLGPGTVSCGDAIAYLEARAGSYDLIVAKALLEHIPKEQLLRIVRALAGALRPEGRVLVDVPNMDWLAAPHERYMDLTHEVGFTRESLAALLRLEFEECDMSGSRIAIETRSQRLFRPLLLQMARRLLYVLGEGASDTLFASRSLIAVARNPRRA